MADFDEIFKATLKSVNEGFELAKNDLIFVVEQISATIKKNSNESFSLSYWAIDESFKSSIYRVVFDPDIEDFESDVVSIGDFLIPSKGYPIFQGIYRKNTDRFEQHSELKNKDDIEKYFIELLSNPDSQLIQAIGYGLRQKNKQEEAF